MTFHIPVCADRKLWLTCTGRIERVRGPLTGTPSVAGALELAIAALMAFPPVSLFASELGITRAGLAAGDSLAWATVTALLLVLGVGTGRPAC